MKKENNIYYCILTDERVIIEKINNILLIVRNKKGECYNVLFNELIKIR